METFSALLALCEGKSPVTGEFPSQRLVTWSLDVFFNLRLNQRVSKQSGRRWFETPSRSLWRHCNGKHNNGIRLYTKNKMALINEISMKNIFYEIFAISCTESCHFNFAYYTRITSAIENVIRTFIFVNCPMAQSVRWLAVRVYGACVYRLKIS